MNVEVKYMKYKCKFKGEEEDDYITIENCEFADEAAKRFAEYAYERLDGWELGQKWREDYSVIVENCDTEEVKTYVIDVDFEPILIVDEIGD